MGQGEVSGKEMKIFCPYIILFPYLLIDKMTCDPLGLKIFHPFIIMCRILVIWLFIFLTFMLVLFLIFISFVEPGLSCYLRSSVFSLWDAGFLVAAYELLVVACRI